VNRNKFGIRLVCAVAACVAIGTPAAAQDRPSGGPFTGLFKGSPKDQPQTLDVRASAFAAWDDNVLAQAPGGGVGDLSLDPRYIKPGIANGFQGSAAYGFRRSGTRSQFNLSGDASVQQFASGVGTGAIWLHSYAASTGLRTNLTNKTSISFGASSAYAPFYQYAPFLKNTTSEESPVGSDYGFAAKSAWVRSSSASASVEDRFSKKSSITGGIGWSQFVMPGNEAGNVDSLSASASFHHSLTRKLGFHVGYGIQEYRNGSTPDAKPVPTHQMDIGLGYGDGLTLTFGRRTTLSMAIGASIARNGDPVSVTTTGKSTAFVLDGSATLIRSIGRSWGASVGYVRGTSYIVGFPEPLMSDSANAGFGGPLTTRLQFSIGAGASRGQRLFSGAGGGSIVSYTGSTRLSYALLSHLGLYGQASYYRFSIPPGFTNFAFVPDLDRRSVSVGLSTWLPLIKHRQPRSSGGQTTTGQQ
jgi:hypothetical protein